MQYQVIWSLLIVKQYCISYALSATRVGLICTHFNVLSVKTVNYMLDVCMFHHDAGYQSQQPTVHYPPPPAGSYPQQNYPATFTGIFLIQ